MSLLWQITHSQALVIVFDRVVSLLLHASKASRDSQSLALNCRVELTSDCQVTVNTFTCLSLSGDPLQQRVGLVERTGEIDRDYPRGEPARSFETV